MNSFSYHKCVRKAVFLLCSTCCIIKSHAQENVPFFGNIQWTNGYAKEISGENISYFSAFPNYAGVALLTRSSNGSKTIEWLTAPVPAKVSGKYVYFAWVASHSSGTNSGMNSVFDLYANDEKILTFIAYPDNQKRNWRADGADSSSLVFQQKRNDGVGDAHGIAFLRLPLSRIKPGQPVKLKVIGQAQGNNNWYMTFKFPYKEMAEVESQPFVLKDGSASLALTALHFGKPAALNVSINRKQKFSFPVKPGPNRFDIPVASAKKKDSVWVAVSLGKEILVDKQVELVPAKPRVIHFIHHSHTDIGYSHLQPEVERIHNKNIGDALDMIDKTSNYTPDARFKWNVESLWAVDNYLKKASPAQIERFVKAVKAGSICLSALYANMLTGMSEPEELFNYTFFAKELKRRYGIEFKSAMISDVPGNSWSIVTALALNGIRYYSSGPNYLGPSHPYQGDRVGHFVKKWGDKPVWWVSPSGEEKILFWAGGRGYSSWHGTSPGAVFDNGPAKIAAYLRDLDKSDYPYEMVQWRYNVVADNGPIDTAISRFVKEWNNRYAWPKIVLNTTDKLFEEFEKKYGSIIPEVKGDLTPYWEDGAMSTAAEEGKNRLNSLQLQQLSTLYTILNPKLYKQKSFDDAWKSIILFHEHTWGAHNSISAPDVPFVTEQWRIKKQFGTDADQQVQAIKESLLKPFTDKASGKIAVINSLSYSRSGPVIIENAGDFNGIKDASGTVLPLQQLSNGKQLFIANNVPALGTIMYTLTKDKPIKLENTLTITDSGLSNGLLTLSWDKNTGSIQSLQAGDQFNYAGSFKGQGLNSYWYVPGVDPADAVTNSNGKITVLENGPLLVAISISSDAPGANKLEKVIRLYANSNAIEIEDVLDKKAVREKEAVHFGFPLHASFDQVRLDAGYGSMRYPGDYLDGANMDYLYGRRWLDVSSADKGIQWLWLETPLVEADSMIDERRLLQGAHKVWKETRSPGKTWFSYVMNNYWHTNYKADQEGVSIFRYALRPHSAYDEVAGEKTAMNFTQPLLAIPLKAAMNPVSSLFKLTNDRVVVTSVVPDGNGKFVIRLYNPSASKETTAFEWMGLKPQKIANVKSKATMNVGQSISIVPMGVMEFEVE